MFMMANRSGVARDRQGFIHGLAAVRVPWLTRRFFAPRRRAGCPLAGTTDSGPIAYVQMPCWLCSLPRKGHRLPSLEMASAASANRRAAVLAPLSHAQNLPKEGGDLPKIRRKSRLSGSTCDPLEANKNPANPLD